MVLIKSVLSYTLKLQAVVPFFLQLKKCKIAEKSFIPQAEVLQRVQLLLTEHVRNPVWIQDDAREPNFGLQNIVAVKFNQVVASQVENDVLLRRFDEKGRVEKREHFEIVEGSADAPDGVLFAFAFAGTSENRFFRLLPLPLLRLFLGFVAALVCFRSEEFEILQVQ